MNASGKIALKVDTAIQQSHREADFFKRNRGRF